MARQPTVQAIPTELASFLPLDPDLLVRASLACPRCFGDVHWEVRGASEDASARCSCPRCGAERDLLLSPEQALRLRIGGRLASDGVPLPYDAW
jgi:hypothetical protein